MNVTRIKRFFPSAIVLFATSSLTWYVSCTPLAVAAPPIGDTTDVDGINLSMSPKQVQSYMLAHNPSATATNLVAQIGTDYYSQQWPVGDYYEIQPTYSDPQRGALDQPGEFLKVIYSPNANDLIGIIRYVGYKSGAFPTKVSVIQALEQKYGAPVSVNAIGGNDYDWAANASFTAGFSGGVTYNDSGTPGHCNIRTIGLDESFLYEESGVLYQNLEATFEAGSQVSSDTSQSFVDVLNNIGSNSSYYANCGVILQVHLGYANNSDYVSSIMERIVDFNRANSELLAVNNTFWANANAAKNAKLNQDSSQKPSL